MSVKPAFPNARQENTAARDTVLLLFLQRSVHNCRHSRVASRVHTVVKWYGWSGAPYLIPLEMREYSVRRRADLNQLVQTKKEGGYVSKDSKLNLCDGE